MALPGERGAEERKRLAGAGGRLEERVRPALPPRAVQRGDDAAHEGQLRAVRLVGELHRHAAHLVHAAAAGRPRGGRGVEVVGVGHGFGAHWWCRLGVCGFACEGDGNWGESSRREVGARGLGDLGGRIWGKLLQKSPRGARHK